MIGCLSVPPDFGNLEDFRDLRTVRGYDWEAMVSIITKKHPPRLTLQSISFGSLRPTYRDDWLVVPRARAQQRSTLYTRSLRVVLTIMDHEPINACVLWFAVVLPHVKSDVFHLGVREARHGKYLAGVFSMDGV